MLFYNGRRSLFESAGEVLSSAELLDPEESKDVEEVMDDLEEILTTNIEEVKPEDKVSTGATEMLKPTAESVNLYETNGKYMVNLFDLLKLHEDAADNAEAAGEEAPEADAAAAAEEVADANGVDSDDLVIVAPVDTAEEIVQNAANEAATGRLGRNVRRMAMFHEMVTSLAHSDIPFEVIQ